MTTTLNDMTAKKRPESSAEELAAKELVTYAKERGLSLTEPDGLLNTTRYGTWLRRRWGTRRSSEWLPSTRTVRVHTARLPGAWVTWFAPSVTDPGPVPCTWTKAQARTRR